MHLLALGAGIALSLVICAVAFRLRHREPLASTSWPWVLVWCIANLAVVVAALEGAAAVTSSYGTASFVTLPVTSTLLLVGVGRSAKGKLRPTLGGNAFTKKIDLLVVAQSRASAASKRQEEIELLLHLQFEPAKLVHVSFDDYVRFLFDSSAPVKLQQQIRVLAHSEMSLEDKLDGLLGYIHRDEHWEFLREQHRKAKKARGRSATQPPSRHRRGRRG